MASAPKWTEYFTLDQVAETWDGIGSDLGRELWSHMQDEEQFETPDMMFESINTLARHWRKFSKDDRKILSRAYRQNFKD